MVETQVSTVLWERRTEGERWVALTNVELEEGGAGEGGAVELWERRADGGLRFGLKVEPLSCVLRVGERRYAFWRKEKAKEGKGCMWGNGRAVYKVLEKYFAFMFLFLVLEFFFFFGFMGFRIFFLKYCADVENYESFKGSGFIYIYIYIY